MKLTNTTAAPFKLIKAESNNPDLQATFVPGASGNEYDVTVRFVGEVTERTVRGGSIKLYTDNPAQNYVSITVSVIQ